MTYTRGVTQTFQPYVAIDDVVFTLELIGDMKCVVGLDYREELYKIYVVARDTLGFSKRSLTSFIKLLEAALQDTSPVTAKPQIDYLNITRGVIA